MQKRFTVFLLIIILLLSHTANSQSTVRDESDSLIFIIKTDRNQLNKIKAFNTLIYQMMWKDMDSAGKMLDSSSRWTKSINKPQATALFNNLKGTYHWFTGNLDSAKKYYLYTYRYSRKHNLQSTYQNSIANLGALYNIMSKTDSAIFYLKKALELGATLQDAKKLAKIHFDLGSVYNQIELNHLALEHLLKSVTYYEQNNDSLRLIYVYTSLGGTYQGIGDFEKARYYGLKAIAYDKNVEEVDLLHDHYNNLGVAHWLEKNDFDSARYYIQKGLDLLPREHSEINRYTYLLNFGGMELDAGNYAKALEYFHQALAIDLPHEDNYRTSALYINLGTAHVRLMNYDSAQYFLKEGIEMAHQAMAYENLANGYSGMYWLDSIRGDYFKALKHYQQYKVFSDSIDSHEVRNRIAELEIIHESEQKEKENIYLRTKNQLNEKVISNQQIIVFIVVAALTIILIFTLILLRNRRKIKQANQQLFEKNEALTESSRIIHDKNTSLQAQKAELEKLNQTKDKFFSVVAHDLKSPFNVLLGFLEILERDFGNMDDDSKYEIIKILHVSSNNTYNLLVNLLEWSRSQRGLIRAVPQKINLRVIAGQALEFLSFRAQQKEHRIENRIDKQLTTLADPMLSQQVFINLINNAIKFTPRTGYIYIDAQRHDDAILISLCDNGIGIPEKARQNLFGLDSQFRQNGTENEQGTGLGLLICHEFITLMNGRIWVESKEGLGSCFHFTLPACD